MEQAMSDPETLSFRVTGMDCANCAQRVRNAVERLPGISDVAITHTTEKLTLTRTESGAGTDAIETRVRALGYGIASLDAQRPASEVHDHDHDHDHGNHGHHHDHGAEEGDVAWWQSRKGRLVILTGAVYLVAFAGKFLLPASEPWLFIAATLIGVTPVAWRALTAARLGTPFTIEMLMSIAAIGALFIGAAEEAALVVFLFAIGELLEGAAAARARTGIKALAKLMPQVARLEENGTVREVPAASLAIGQTVLVRPGDRLPADGEIVDGQSDIDQSPVTGESVPVMRGMGEGVFAGTVNGAGTLRVKVTRAAADNTIARIITLVEEAQEARAPTERFIDRFSRWYMPAITGLAVLVAIVPPLVGLGDFSLWLYRALTLLLIGCPCALVISVPAAIASALSSGARVGMLLKGGAVLESVAATKAVAIDKTGTLTLGAPKVTDIVGIAGDENEVLTLAASVEAGSSHPLAAAILAEAQRRGLTLRPAGNGKALAGHGVAAEIDGKTVFVGRHGDVTEAQRLEAEGKTVAAVTLDEQLIGLIALRDEPREDAIRGLADLKRLGITATMLTGDNAATAQAIAAKLGIAAKAGLMPDDKVSAVKAFGANVMMVGDGINDAPALAAASTGIAMGAGTDVALETADGALLSNRVADIAGLVRLARAAMANIRQNVTIALGLKAIFLVTSILGITGLWPAILADTGATVLVTANALRLLRFNPQK
jgi:Cd2+/Zn2+-exporting ATPase